MGLKFHPSDAAKRLSWYAVVLGDFPHTTFPGFFTLYLANIFTVSIENFLLHRIVSNLLNGVQTIKVFRAFSQFIIKIIYTVKKLKGFALYPRDLTIPVSKFIFRTVEK